MLGHQEALDMVATEAVERNYQGGRIQVGPPRPPNYERKFSQPGTYDEKTANERTIECKLRLVRLPDGRQEWRDD